MGLCPSRSRAVSTAVVVTDPPVENAQHVVLKGCKASEQVKLVPIQSSETPPPAKKKEYTYDDSGPHLRRARANVQKVPVEKPPPAPPGLQEVEPPAKELPPWKKKENRQPIKNALEKSEPGEPRVLGFGPDNSDPWEQFLVTKIQAKEQAGTSFARCRDGSFTKDYMTLLGKTPSVAA